MKRDHIVYLVVILFAILLYILAGCGKTVYVPVESVKTEYRDNYVRDSITRYDSVYFAMKGDTVWLERYKYLWREKIVRDSVFVNDTVRVPYPVVEEKIVYRLRWWQKALAWGGVVLILIVGFRVSKKWLFKR